MHSCSVAHNEQKSSLFGQALADQTRCIQKSLLPLSSFTKNDLQYCGQYLTSIFSEDFLDSVPLLKEKNNQSQTGLSFFLLFIFPDIIQLKARSRNQPSLLNVCFVLYIRPPQGLHHLRFPDNCLPKRPTALCPESHLNSKNIKQHKW